MSPVSPDEGEAEDELPPSGNGQHVIAQAGTALHKENGADVDDKVTGSEEPVEPVHVDCDQARFNSDSFCEASDDEWGEWRYVPKASASEHSDDTDDEAGKAQRLNGKEPAPGPSVHDQGACGIGESAHESTHSDEDDDDDNWGDWTYDQIMMNKPQEQFQKSKGSEQKSGPQSQSHGYSITSGTRPTGQETHRRSNGSEQKSGPQSQPYAYASATGTRPGRLSEFVVKMQKRMESPQFHYKDIRNIAGGALQAVLGRNLQQDDIVVTDDGASSQTGEMINVHIQVPILDIQMSLPISRQVYETPDGSAMAHHLLSAILLLRLQPFLRGKQSAHELLPHTTTSKSTVDRSATSEPPSKKYQLSSKSKAQPPRKKLKPLSKSAPSRKNVRPSAAPVPPMKKLRVRSTSEQLLIDDIIQVVRRKTVLLSSLGNLKSPGQSLSFAARFNQINGKTKSTGAVSFSKWLAGIPGMELPERLHSGGHLPVKYTGVKTLKRSEPDLERPAGNFASPSKPTKHTDLGPHRSDLERPHGSFAIRESERYRSLARRSRPSLFVQNPKLATDARRQRCKRQKDRQRPSRSARNPKLAVDPKPSVAVVDLPAELIEEWSPKNTVQPETEFAAETERNEKQKSKAPAQPANEKQKTEHSAPAAKGRHEKEKGERLAPVAQQTPTTKLLNAASGSLQPDVAESVEASDKESERKCLRTLRASSAAKDVPGKVKLASLILQPLQPEVSQPTAASRPDALLGEKESELSERLTLDRQLEREVDDDDL